MKYTPLLAALALAASLVSAPAAAAPWRVSIDTSALAGVAGAIALDFAVGAPGSSNQVRIGNLAFDGSFGSAQSTGSVAGSLRPGPLTLGGGAFFSEWLQFVTGFGSSIAFDLDLGEAVNAGGVADQFSFFLLDGNQLPFATSDPTGAGALFYLDLAGAATQPVVYTSAFASARVQPIVAGVPEPASLLLVMAAACAALAAARRRPGAGPVA